MSDLPRSASADAKRPTNVSLPGELLIAAREAGINLSALLERALTDELAERVRLQWRAKNAGAIAAYNDNLMRDGTFSMGRRIF